MNEPSNLKAAQEAHHKFEFYLVALTFTILGFSIQTGKFTENFYGDFAEVFSWVALLSSGLIGLSRLEHFPVLYRVHDFITTRKQLMENLEDNKTQTPNNLKKQLEEYESEHNKIETKNRKKYLWQKRFLITGLLGLIIARIITLTTTVVCKFN